MSQPPPKFFHNFKMLIIAMLAAFVKSAQFCPETGFCIEATVNANQACYTVNSESSGWAGIGIGSSAMAGSEIYVGWKNSTGGYTIVNLQGQGRFKPSAGNVPFVTSKLIGKPSSFAKLSFSFCKSDSVGVSVKSGTQKFIYASHSSAPNGNIDLKTANFGFHADTYGSFSLNVQTGGGGGTSGPAPILKASNSFPITTVHLIHGILMWVAWVVSPMIGIYVARYLKTALGHTWFVIHRFLMGVLTIFVSFVSFVLIFLYRPLLKTPGSNIESSHVIVGFIIVLMMFFQGYLGYYSDKKFSLVRTKIPWWDKLHWWVGRALFLLGLVNVYLGIFLYENNGNPVSDFVKIAHFTALCIGLLAFIYGEVKLGQDNHVK
jgi:hypothetical protein